MILSEGHAGHQRYCLISALDRQPRRRKRPLAAAAPTLQIDEAWRLYSMRLTARAAVAVSKQGIAIRIK
jgi:hypothetical protein